MGTLEQVQQMRNRGMPDEEIVNGLRNQGISPREIDDAMNQANVKDAVTQGGDYEPEEDYSSEEEYAPQENYASQEYEEQYPQENQSYENYSNTGSTENLIEIAEQVFSEKIKKLEKKLNEFNEFKTLAESKIDNFGDRLKRIETLMDQLQIKILDKVGSYGHDLSRTKKEMEMMQDSFGKMVNDVADKSSKKLHKK